MRTFLALLLFSLSLFADNPKKPLAVVINYHLPRYEKQASLGVKRDLEKAGYEVIYRDQPTVEDLKALREKTAFAPLTPVFFFGHGSVLDPKTMKSRERNKKTVYDDADLRHFIVREHGGEDKGIQTSTLIQALDPTEDKLSFIFNSCHSGRICLDCKACVGAACRKEEIAFAMNYDPDVSDHFIRLIAKLLTGPVENFTRYTNGRCTIEPAELQEYFKDEGSYEETVEILDAQYLDQNRLHEGTLVKGYGRDYWANRLKSFREANEEWAQGGKDRSITFTEEHTFAITYEDADGKRQVFPDDVFSNRPMRFYGDDGSPEALKRMVERDGWDWPKTCGKDASGKPRTKCEIYQEGGKVLPMNIGIFAVRRTKKARKHEPARTVVDHNLEEMTQTPQLGKLRLRHTKCVEKASTHRDEKGSGRSH